MLVTGLVMLRILDRLYGTPFIGFAEYAQTLVVWVIFLGIGRAAYHGDDIRSEWVLNKLPERPESFLRGLILVSNAVTVAILLVAAVSVLLEFQGRTTPGAGIPFPILHGALVTGSALLLAVYFVKISSGARSIVEALS